jgi:hypothetical protein
MAELKNQVLASIMRGVRVRLYSGVTFNTDGTVKNIQADGSLVVADHPGAIEWGFTQDGAELTRATTREGLPVDQRQTEVLISMMSQVPHLKFGMLQVLDFENLQKVVPGSVYQSGDDFEGISDQLDQTIELTNVVAIAPRNDDPDNHQVLVLYAASNVADMALKLSKAFHKMPVDFQGEDAGRADGKTWMAYVTKTPAP